MTTDSNKLILNHDFFMRQGYFSARRLDDGTWIAIERLLFTTGLCVDLDFYGWQRRYCYEALEMCVFAYEDMKTINDIPVGWVAKRPKDKR